MGPGCFHPRNPAVFHNIHGSRVASMGPGCFHPRNMAPGSFRGEFTQLQWGRDVSIPEMTLTPAPGYQVDPLQWGRDVSIPEMGARLICLALFPQGFNGAGMFPSQKCEHEVVCGPEGTCFNGAGMFPSQ